MEINEKTLIEDLVKEHPETIKVFVKHGMPCIVCGEPLWGTIEENARRYGVDLKSLLKDLNESNSSKPLNI